MFNFNHILHNNVATILSLPQPKKASLKNGDIEYVIHGEGKPILILHGGVGGYDQSLILFRNLIPQGFKLICPSRPGFLGTPLSSGKSINEQVELINQLLEYLKIDEVSIISMSAGGLIMYPFAIKYAKKVKSIVGISAISSKYMLPEQVSRWAQSFFMTDVGLWLTKESFLMFPEMTIKKFLDSGSAIRPEQMNKRVQEIISSPLEMMLVNEIITLMTDYAIREAGTTNDILNGENLDKFDLAKINCPSLIIHGTHDNEVRFYNGVYAYEDISSKIKERNWIDYGTHFSFFFASQSGNAQEQFINFINKHC
jgi:pimeloyl-ACP methyl ester carboxylesterase